LWQQNKTGTTSNVKIFQSDASELGLKLPSGSVAAIATEPYLGKPLRGNEPRALLEAQIKELKKIYLAAFAAFAKILTRGAVVVFVIPCFDFKGSWLRIDCKKEIERLGFTTDSVLEDYEYILYARPKQRVGREIWRFKKN
jgi:tRNA G10  N-methylase Trm11